MHTWGTRDSWAPRVYSRLTTLRVLLLKTLVLLLKTLVLLLKTLVLLLKTLVLPTLFSADSSRLMCIQFTPIWKVISIL